jgi:hypothetical protein
MQHMKVSPFISTQQSEESLFSSRASALHCEQNSHSGIAPHSLAPHAEHWQPAANARTLRKDNPLQIYHLGEGEFSGEKFTAAIMNEHAL